jgi:hypothetical protein
VFLQRAVRDCPDRSDDEAGSAVRDHVVALGGDDPFPSWNEVRELDLLLLPLRLDRLVDARHYLGSHRAFGNAAADDDEPHLRERVATLRGRLDSVGDGAFVHAIGRHVDRARAHLLASASPPSSDTSAITTLAPICASLRTVAEPKPPAPPVTIAEALVRSRRIPKD